MDSFVFSSRKRWIQAKAAFCPLLMDIPIHRWEWCVSCKISYLTYSLSADFPARILLNCILCCYFFSDEEHFNSSAMHQRFARIYYHSSLSFMRTGWITSMKKMLFFSIISAMVSAMYGIFDLSAISTAFHSLILILALLIVLPFIFIAISLGAVILVTAKKEHKIFFQARWMYLKRIHPFYRKGIYQYMNRIDWFQITDDTTH